VSIYDNKGKKMKGIFPKILMIIGMWWFTEYAYCIDIKAEIKGDTASVAKIQKVLPGVQKVINSEAFKARVLKAKYTTTKDSPEVIYQKIMASKWDLDLRVERHWLCRVKGWTNPGTKTIWFNSCGFAQRTDAGLAGTICHETLHKIGYDHKNANDLMSVPYSIGNIVSELYGKTN
jgi:hypothetical protein